MTDCNFLGFKISADGDCSHEIKRCLLLGRKTMTNLDSILKSRDTTLSMKVHKVKAMVFPVVRYGCESQTIKSAECQRINAFELWCWRRLESSCTEGSWNQSILKELNPEYSLEGLMLKFQYFGHLMQRANSLEKTLMLGKIEEKGRGWQRLDSIASVDIHLSTFWEIMDYRGIWCATFFLSWSCKESNTT